MGHWGPDDLRDDLLDDLMMWVMTLPKAEKLGDSSRLQGAEGEGVGCRSNTTATTSELSEVPE
jgi:hypothetical protein